MEKRKRFYVEPESVAGDTVTVTGSEYNHIVNVMRQKVGDSVVLCTGDGVDLYATLTAVERSAVCFRIEEQLPNPNEAQIELTAFLAALKGDKLEYSVQKVSELGAAAVVPFYSRYTVAKNVKVDRLQKIAVESAKQCQRSRILKVHEALTLPCILETFNQFDVVLFACEFERERDIKSVLNGLKRPERIAVVVGSEGGFSEEEYEKIVQAGAIPVSLGGRILRAETAAVTMASIVMYHFDQMGKPQ